MNIPSNTSFTQTYNVPPPPLLNHKILGPLFIKLHPNFQQSIINYLILLTKKPVLILLYSNKINALFTS